MGSPRRDSGSEQKNADTGMTSVRDWRSWPPRHGITAAASTGCCAVADCEAGAAGAARMWPPRPRWRIRAAPAARRSGNPGRGNLGLRGFAAIHLKFHFSGGSTPAMIDGGYEKTAKLTTSVFLGGMPWTVPLAILS